MISSHAPRSRHMLRRPGAAWLKGQLASSLPHPSAPTSRHHHHADHAALSTEQRDGYNASELPAYRQLAPTARGLPGGASRWMRDTRRRLIDHLCAPVHCSDSRQACPPTWRHLAPPIHRLCVLARSAPTRSAWTATAAAPEPRPGQPAHRHARPHARRPTHPPTHLAILASRPTWCSSDSPYTSASSRCRQANRKQARSKQR